MGKLQVCEIWFAPYFNCNFNFEICLWTDVVVQESGYPLQISKRSRFCRSAPVLFLYDFFFAVALKLDGC